MSNPIPRKSKNRVDSASDAITTAVQAASDAAARGTGVNQEVTFPGGRLVLRIGEITHTRTPLDGASTPQSQL